MRSEVSGLGANSAPRKATSAGPASAKVILVQVERYDLITRRLAKARRPGSDEKALSRWGPVYWTIDAGETGTEASPSRGRPSKLPARPQIGRRYGGWATSTLYWRWPSMIRLPLLFAPIALPTTVRSGSLSRWGPSFPQCQTLFPCHEPQYLPAPSGLSGIPDRGSIKAWPDQPRAFLFQLAHCRTGRHPR